MKPEREQTLGFLMGVAFQPARKKYDQFLKVVEDYKLKRIHVTVLRSNLKNLIESHGNLIFGFENFLKAVKLALKEDEYVDFSKVTEGFVKREIDERCLVARVEVVLNRHVDLLAEFKTLLPIQLRILLPGWDQLHWDILYVISQKLDFDDLFQFSSVCANWRGFYKSIDKSNFLTSKEPLLIEFLNTQTQAPDKVPYSFTSLPNQKVYRWKNDMLMSYSEVSFPIYVTYSSGYFVIIADSSSILLINPFTRINKKVISPSTFNFTFYYRYHALLAFDKCSEEFVLVFLFKNPNSLHVYESRSNGWVSYSTAGNIVVDFVAFNNRIYVLTNKAAIGVLSLNSANIDFLNLKKTPRLGPDFSCLNLVKCDEELLVVRLNPGVDKKFYKIDFSNMTYVKLETLGDVALFYVCFKSCKALSNPSRWGYESNSVYAVSTHTQNTNCGVYNWGKKSKKYIKPPIPKTKQSVYDWCFRHLRYEVDYSLVE